MGFYYISLHEPVVSRQTRWVGVDADNEQDAYWGVGRLLKDLTVPSILDQVMSELRSRSDLSHEDLAEVERVLERRFGTRLGYGPLSMVTGWDVNPSAVDVVIERDCEGNLCAHKL